MERSTSTVLRKGAWTKEEDDLLRDCIHKNGEGKWHLVPQRAGLNRCRKSCRLRWMSYLKPTIKRGDFEEDEVDLIMRLHRLLGNRWSLIAGRLPGRTPNDVKNFFHTHLKKLMVAPQNDGIGNNKLMNAQLQSFDPLPIKPQPTTLVNTTTPLLAAGTAPSDGNYYPNFAEMNLVAKAPAAAANLIPSSPENWTDWWANLMVDLENDVDNNDATNTWDEGETQHTNQYGFQGEKLV